MKKIMFVCHGNICRSPMAEFLMKELVKQNGKTGEYFIRSSATSSEELYNPVHYGTRKILNAKGIDCSNKHAEKLEKITASVPEPEYTVDPAILGGVIVEYEGRILDGSLIHRLQEVKDVIDT